MSTLAVERFNAEVARMLSHLSTFLPVAVPPAPQSTLALLEAAERPVGVGSFSGNVERGPLAVLGVRGGRVEGRVRFDLRAPSPGDAADAALQLQQRVRQARVDPLTPWMRDFVVLEPAGGDPATLLSPTDGWRQGVEYRVLFEYRYEDPEEAGGLIVRIPIELRGEQHEDDAVTRDLTRWDFGGAPPLVLRGPRTVGRLSLLAHTAGSPPPGRVVVRRTFDGAPAPAVHGSLAAFAAAVLPPGAGRNDEHALANVQALLTAFAPAGAAVALARLSERPAPPPVVPHDPQPLQASFGPRALDALRGVRLETPADRLEISYEFPAGFPDISGTVVYLGTARGPRA